MLPDFILRILSSFLSFFLFFPCSSLKSCWILMRIFLKNSITYIQCFEVWYHACIFTWFEIYISLLWCLIVIGWLCLISKALLVSLIRWLIEVCHMSIIYSNVSTLPIVAICDDLYFYCLSSLTLPPSVVFDWFTMKERNKSSIFLDSLNNSSLISFMCFANNHCKAC